ncbi:MAG: hypothetical protein JO266_08200 [Acidobacteria bacterium]|nr:hypothetical protein [Acidobacteriota bacterium]MBV9482370.1 hypothetical protein [Acidobacteriota bacterium]
MSGEKLECESKWALLYKAAVSEADDRRRLHLIARTKGAIFKREQALLRAGSEDIQERHALQDAAYILAALRKAAEFNLEGEDQLPASSKAARE